MKDTRLIEGLRRRDKAVFDFIFNSYYSSLCTFSLQYVNDRNAAEDLVQDFFVSVWIAAPNLQINTSLKSYLYAAVKNRCLDFQKHHKVTEKFRSFLLFAAETDDHSSEQYLTEGELRQAIEQSLSKLSPRCREIFELSRLNGLSNQEIAGKLNLSKRTVELQITNSLRTLRKELAEYLPMWLIVWLLG